MRTTPTALTAALLLAAPTPFAAAQETLERTPTLSGGWVGQTGTLYANLPARFFRVPTESGREIAANLALDLGLGLPYDLLAGFRFAPESPVIPGKRTEWEALARYRPLAEADGEHVDLAVTLAFNGAAGSLDGELSLARWLGPLRVLGALRGFSDAFGSDDARLAVAGGAVLHPLAGRAPIALAADVALPTVRSAGEEIAWSAALQLGVSFTDHTLSLFATNTASPTLQGSSRGEARTRVGIELTVPVALGRFVGRVVPREIAAEAVVARPPSTAPAETVDMARYLFLPKRIEIPVGATVEWINRDGVVHTVNAEDGSWHSGAVEPGQGWRARFDRPGRYLYYCGPHPFMKGEILVR
jgi:plastocyanin